MHSQQLGRLRDIAAAIRQNPLHVLPFDAGQARHLRRRPRARALAIANALKRGQHLVHVHRLAEVMVRPALDGLDGRGDAPIAGQHDDRDRGVQLPELPHDVEPGFVRQAQVHDGKVGRRFGCQSARRGAVGGSKRLPTAQRKGLAQSGAEPFVVIDDQRRRLVLVAHGRGKGNSRVTLVPAPASDSNSRLPFRASAYARTRNVPRPIPRPGGLVVKNGCATRSSVSRRIPQPESSTVKRSFPWAHSAVSNTGWLPSLASSAFLTSAVSACRVASGGSVTSWPSPATSVRTSSLSGEMNPCFTLPSASLKPSGTGVSPSGSAPRILICCRIPRQRSTSERIRRASVATSPFPNSRSAYNSRSLETTAMVPRGVPSSCAAPAAKVTIAASRSSLAAWSRSNRASCSLRRKASETLPMNMVITRDAAANAIHIPARCTENPSEV